LPAANRDNSIGYAPADGKNVKGVRVKRTLALVAAMSLALLIPSTASAERLEIKAAKKKTERVAKRQCGEGCVRSYATNCDRLSRSKVACDAINVFANSECTTRTTWVKRGDKVLLTDLGRPSCR
jgi:hypothetical protein